MVARQAVGSGCAHGAIDVVETAHQELIVRDLAGARRHGDECCYWLLNCSRMAGCADALVACVGKWVEVGWVLGCRR